MVVVAALGLAAGGCSAGGTGTRDEGSAAHADAAPPSTTFPQFTGVGGLGRPKVDPVRLVLDDPKVSKQVKSDLKPCAEDEYPVDTSYGSITGSTVPDVVVNVLTCGDAIGVGTYVYRGRVEDASDVTYRNVFALEEPAVYSTIDRGDLVVTKQVYADDDPVTYPSGEDVITYRWAGARFSERDRVHNDYNNPVGDPGPVDEEPAQQDVS
ncbi:MULTISPECIES: hypothetical protein [Streptomyces]|uniref:Lipoprotein CseA n=1 Tax=Streptomyces lichenis TaxID=2306967 RepID=A0ABT0I942_9ACTN|nr:hypothetical protein [Streptomyces lichenis]MCK8677828.1 hypothetical protein [Streptomyces lichenis]